METVGLAFYLAGQGDRAAEMFQTALADKPSPQKAAAYYYYLAGALDMARPNRGSPQGGQPGGGPAPRLAAVPESLSVGPHRAQRYAEAERELLDLLDKHDSNYDSANVRVAVREARFLLSNICAVQNRLAQAEEWLEQILDEFPEDVAARNDLGYLWADQGRHLNRALTMVRAAVEREPHNRAYRDSLGWVYFRLGRYADAVRELEQAARSDKPTV